MRRKTTVDHKQHIENKVLFRHSLKMREEVESRISEDRELHTLCLYCNTITYELKVAGAPSSW